MKFKWRNLIFVLGMFVVVILLMAFSQRLEELDDLTERLTSVQAEATAVIQTQVALFTQVAFSSSDEAVEQWAYEDGKWVRPGEKLVEIVPEGNSTPTSSVASPAIPTEQPKWRIWWELFFGEKP